jgi:hypothetical protein
MRTDFEQPSSGGSKHGENVRSLLAVRHFHQQRWRDLRRDNAGVAEGKSVLRYGMGDVTERSCEVAGQVAVVLARGGWLGIPIRCGQDCLINEVIRPAYDRDELPRC